MHSGACSSLAGEGQSSSELIANAGAGDGHSVVDCILLGRSAAGRSRFVDAVIAFQGEANTASARFTEAIGGVLLEDSVELHAASSLQLGLLLFEESLGELAAAGRADGHGLLLGDGFQI